MFQVEQKPGNSAGKSNQADKNNIESNINPAEMLREQNKALQRHSGMSPESFEPMQMQEDEEKIQEKEAPTQMMEDKEEEIQAKKGQHPDSSAGKTTNSFANLNMSLQAKMQNSFSTSFQDVDIHQNDASATRMGALAYTQGNNVHFAPGQFNPNTQGGQELLGHELTHVVQQREGRVQPTKQGKGKAVNDSPTLENEADNIGNKAANGQQVDVVGKGSGVQKQEDNDLSPYEKMQQERDEEYREMSMNDRTGDQVLHRGIGADNIVSGVSLLGTIQIWTEAGHYSGYRTKQVVSTDDPVKWSQILNSGFNTQRDCLRGFLLVATDEANYVGTKEIPGRFGKNTLVDVSRGISEKEKAAFMRALFSQTKSEAGPDSLLPVDFTLLITEYHEDGLLAKFINDNFHLATEGFNEFNESPASGTETLVNETTTDSNKYQGIPRENPISGGRHLSNQVIEVIPPVMEAIITNAYGNALATAKKIIMNGGNKEHYEQVRRYAQMIRGAILGHNKSLESINAQNKFVFNMIWNSIPFTNDIDDGVLKTLLERLIDVTADGIERGFTNNSLEDPDEIGDKFGDTLDTAYDSFVAELDRHDPSEKSKIKVTGAEFESIISAFNSGL